MITTFMDHDNCGLCGAALQEARTMAQVTGSVGSRVSRETVAHGGEVHRAAWFRDGSDPRPEDS